MSEAKYWLAGKVCVPENKKAEMNSDVLTVLNLCGIRKQKTLSLAGQNVTVLAKPKADDRGIVEFDYSIFEKKSRAVSTYDINSCELHTEDRGVCEYGLVMNLILLLQECRSDGSCYFMKNRDLVCSLGYMDLLCTILNKRIEINSRARIWDIMRFMRNNPECDMPRISDLCKDIPLDYTAFDYYQMLAAYVTTDNYELGNISKDTNGRIEDRSHIKNAEISDKLIYLNRIMSAEFEKDEESIYEYVKTLLELPISDREKLAEAEDNYGIIAELSLYLLPPCMVYVFAQLKQADFWETWDSFGIEGYSDIVKERKSEANHTDDANHTDEANHLSETNGENTFYQSHKMDFYLLINRDNQDEFLEYWDGENLSLSDSMKKEIMRWKTLWDTTDDDPSIDAESQLAEILRAMEQDWSFRYVSCRYVDEEFVNMLLTHKEDPNWRRLLSVLKKVVDYDMNLFPELDERTAAMWMRTYRPEFDYTAMSAFCSLICNQKQRETIFGF